MRAALFKYLVDELTQTLLFFSDCKVGKYLDTKQVGTTTIFAAPKNIGKIKTRISKSSTGRTYLPIYRQ